MESTREKWLDPGGGRGENKPTFPRNHVALAGTVLCSLHDSYRFPKPRLSVLLLFSGGAADSYPCPACHGEAKFWIEPEIELAQNYGLSARGVATALRLIRQHEDEIRAAWEAHFGR